MNVGYVYDTYTVEYDKKRLILVTDIHNCHLHRWHGVVTEERLDRLCESLNEEYEREPYDAILALGDYSLDFWLFKEGGSYLWDPPVSNTEEFVKKYLPKMPARFYMIPGNHEQYGHYLWKKITGFPREYAIVYGDTVFAMLDTFGGDLDPKVNHDGCYTGINTEFLTQVLEDHPEKRVVICAHDIDVTKESEAARQLIVSEPRIACAFAGHIHKDHTVLLPTSWRSFPVFYCGDFSYNRGRDKEVNWGYRRLQLARDKVYTEYAKVQ